MLLHKLLQYTIDNACSDLFIMVNTPPCVRKDGEVVPIENMPPLDETIIQNDIIEKILDKQPHKRAELLNNKQVDMSYELDEGNRFRVNIFSQRGHYSVVIRRINSTIPNIEQLGLPESVKYFTTLKKGLVLVTGPTGSGKSTTLASLIDIINSTQRKHIITIEDPIEYLYKNKMSIVNQREIGQDVVSFSLAVKSALRENPDIVLVGEMRDLETIENALIVAETGHLVFGTLHTNSATQSINRIIDVFPPEQQQQVRIQLSSVLEGVISQLLIPKIGGGVVCACEVMIVNDAIRAIIREGKQITEVNNQMIMMKKKFGTQTLDQCLAELFIKGKITIDTAMHYATDKETLKKMIAMMS